MRSQVRRQEAVEHVLSGMPYRRPSYVEHIESIIDASGLLERITECEALCAELADALTHYVAKVPDPDAAVRAMYAWGAYFSQHLGAEL